MLQKAIFHRLLPGFYLLSLSALLLALSRVSYRAKELLVCWLFFCSLFAVVALMFLGAILAWYAGRHLAQWVRVAMTIIPELAARFAELPQEAIPGLEILVAGTLKTPAGPDVSLDAFESHSGTLFEPALQPRGVSESEQTLSSIQASLT